jgi:predicted ATPase
VLGRGMVMRVKSRQVTEFPQPWDEVTTPYALNEFTPSARSLSELASQDQLMRLSSSSSSSGSRSNVSVRMAKAVFVGDVGVGKTSIINRFCRDIFELQYKATIGVDYEMERFWILNVPFNLQM